MKFKFLRKFGFKVCLPLFYSVFVLLMLLWNWLISVDFLPHTCSAGSFFCIDWPIGLLVLTAMPVLLLAGIFNFDFLTNQEDSTMLFGLLIAVVFYFLVGLLFDLNISFFKWNKADMEKKRLMINKK